MCCPSPSHLPFDSLSQCIYYMPFERSIKFLHLTAYRMYFNTLPSPGVVLRSAPTSSYSNESFDDVPPFVCLHPTVRCCSSAPPWSIWLVPTRGISLFDLPHPLGFPSPDVSLQSDAGPRSTRFLHYAVSFSIFYPRLTFYR